MYRLNHHHHNPTTTHREAVEYYEDQENVRNFDSARHRSSKSTSRKISSRYNVGKSYLKSASVPLSLHKWKNPMNANTATATASKKYRGNNRVEEEEEEERTIVSTCTASSKVSQGSVMRRMKKRAGLLNWRVNKAGDAGSSRTPSTTMQSFFQQANVDVPVSGTTKIERDQEDVEIAVEEERKDCRRALHVQSQIRSEPAKNPSSPMPSSQIEISNAISDDDASLNRNQDMAGKDFGTFLEEMKCDLNADHSEDWVHFQCMFGKTKKSCRPLARSGKAYSDSSKINLKISLNNMKSVLLSNEGISKHFDGASQLLNDRFRSTASRSVTFKEIKLAESLPMVEFTKKSSLANDALLNKNDSPNTKSSVTSYLEARKQLRATPTKQPTLLGTAKSTNSHCMYQPVVTQTVNSVIAKTNLRKTPTKSRYSSSNKSSLFESERTAKGLVQQHSLISPIRTPLRECSKQVSPPFSSARKALRKVKRKSPIKKRSPMNKSIHSVSFADRSPKKNATSSIFNNDQTDDVNLVNSDENECSGEVINMQSIFKVEAAQRDGQFSALVTVFRVFQMCEGLRRNAIIVLGPKCILVIDLSSDELSGKVTKSLQRDDITSLRNDGMIIEITQAALKFEFKSNAECLNFMHLFYIRRPIGTPAARRLKERRRLSGEPDNIRAGYDILTDRMEGTNNSREGKVYLTSTNGSREELLKAISSESQDQVTNSSEKTSESHKLSLKVETHTECDARNTLVVSTNAKTTNSTLGLSNSSTEVDTQFTPAVDPRSAMLAAIAAKGNGESKGTNDEAKKPINVKPKVTSASDARSAMLAAISSRGENAKSQQSSSDSEKKSDTLLSEDEGKISKYQKMLKMKVPPEAVRQKMIIEGIEQRLMSIVLGNNTGMTSHSCNDLVLTSEEEESVTKYRTMIKINVPPPAVRHKMTLDGISERLISIVCNDNTGVSPQRISKSNKLSDEDEQILSSYRKMNKILPIDALRHKMKMDGIEERLIDAFFGVSEGTFTKKSQGKSRGLISLHWTPLSPTSAEQSFWAKTPAKGKTVEEKDLLQLEQLFSRKKKAPNNTQSLASNGLSRKKQVGILDANQVRNITITLTSFNKTFESHDDLLNTIEELDPQRRVSGDNLQFLEQLLPKDEDSKLLLSFKGNRSVLQPSELFLLRIVSIPRVNEKIGVIQTMGTFNEIMEELTLNFNLLSNVCKQIRESHRLTKILDTVREVGNFLNEGTHAGGVSGFKLESLLKLTETKSNDGKTTVLDYIVQLLIKDDRDSLMLLDDLNGAADAARILITDLVNEGRRIGIKLSKCKSELAKLQVNSDNGSSCARRLKCFIEDADRRLADLSKLQESTISACKTTAINFGEKNGEQSAISVINVLMKFATAVNVAVNKYEAKMERENRKVATTLLRKSKSRRKSGQGIQLRRRRSFIRTRSSSSRSPVKSRSPLLREVSKMLKSPGNMGIPTLGRRMERSSSCINKASNSKLDFSKE